MVGYVGKVDEDAESVHFGDEFFAQGPGLLWRKKKQGKAKKQKAKVTQ